MLIWVSTKKEKGVQFPFAVELIMNSQFDWMESYTPRTLDSGSQTSHEALKYSHHLKQWSTVLPHPRN
jgi:hypothetical protein